ncbi:hypothetical protein DMC30DRAFT_419380 [Rhodotorula diobovata]|uniref:Signal recognition particle receptor subunit beta n=1 Tax=Rhodotorula diobovata TaxID=5288 RepID=A0A5C5FNK9_9BASI|nr:hypothetical protein DMC30DRAFT_419380 [Rhodotorula diobovata]
MASPQPTPELTSLLGPLAAGPSALSPMRVFAALLVCLALLLLTPRRTLHPVALRAKRTGARTLLLVGPLASGKTALFSKLVYGHAPQTHTSMKENEAVVKAKWGHAGDDKGDNEVEGERPAAQPLATPLHLVDLPGHARLRTRALAQYLPAADGVVFAVDGQSGLTGKNVRDAGEHFHILLSLLSLLSSSSKPAPPVLILLTKADLLPSSSSSSTSPQLSIDRAKQLLLRELERRRLAASGAGSASSSSRGANGAGGAPPLSAGARLDGLEAIPSSSASSGSGSSASAGLLSSLLSTLGLSSSSRSSSSASLNPSGASSSAAGLPSDESEVLAQAADDVWAFDGPATWEKVQRAVGVELCWAVASVRGGEKARGVGEVWEWVEGL